MTDAQTPTSPLMIDNISKSYGAHKVLDRVSLTLNPGEIFGLVGLNGVGKTTLIKIILDLAKADEGGVQLHGVAHTHVRARDHLSYLPEKFQPSSYLHGMEYLSLALSYYRKPLDEVEARLMARKVDLDPDALPRKVKSYSKGMGQKLGLMGAFLADQPLLILDEPMSGLDPRARVCLKQLLLQMKQEGKTLFFSSHILSDIDEICDRIGVIHNGKLLFVGTAQDFKSQWKKADLEQAFLGAIQAA